MRCSTWYVFKSLRFLHNHKNHFLNNLVVRVLNSVQVTGKRDCIEDCGQQFYKSDSQKSRVFQTNSFQLGFINHGTIDTSHFINCCLEQEEPFKHGQTCYGRNTMFCQVKHSIRQYGVKLQPRRLGIDIFLENHFGGVSCWLLVI